MGGDGRAVVVRQKVRQRSVPAAATGIDGRIPLVRAADILLRTPLSQPADLPALAAEGFGRELREVVVQKYTNYFAQE